MWTIFQINPLMHNKTFAMKTDKYTGEKFSKDREWQATWKK